MPACYRCSRAIYSMRYPRTATTPSTVYSLEKTEHAPTYSHMRMTYRMESGTDCFRAFDRHPPSHGHPSVTTGSGRQPPKRGDGSFMRQAVEKMQAGEVWPVGENAHSLQFVTYSGHNPLQGSPENLRTVTFSDHRFPERMRDYMMMAHYTDSAIGTLLSLSALASRLRPHTDSDYRRPRRGSQWIEQPF